MRRKPTMKMERFRLTTGHYRSTAGAGNNGAFVVPIDGVRFLVIVSDGLGWDHVSVSPVESGENRCPSWEEMKYVKDAFFEDEESVMQLHPPKSEYFNRHQYCLHLWRPQDAEIPRPPAKLVDLGEASMFAREFSKSVGNNTEVGVPTNGPGG